MNRLRPSRDVARRVGLPLVIALLAGACSPDAQPPKRPTPAAASEGPTDESLAPQSQSSAAADPEPDPRVDEVIAILTVPPADAGGEAENAWLDGRRAFMESLGPDSAELGRVMVDAFEARPEIDVAVRRGMIEAIARTQCEGGAELLARLVGEYGVDLGVRTTAAERLWLASPDIAIATLEPLLRDEPRGTYPPEESLLAGWLDAMNARDDDPTAVLTLIATDLYREDAARHLAVKSLGKCKTDGSRAALEAVLIESTGNAYLRRMAAQQVVLAFDADEACELLERVLNREADMNMQIFLANLVTQNCP
ncbi:MAG: hypothetical protein ACYSWX_01945 [Planctomycetota bacterium]|jgi:hypothetical protein